MDTFNFQKFADEIYFISKDGHPKAVLCIVNIKEVNEIMHEIRFLHTKNCIEQQFFMKTIEVSPENIVKLFTEHGYNLSSN